jgi:UDP-2,3-diacylglucosamine hydrolase
MHVFLSDVHIRTETSYRAQLFMKFLREKRSDITGLYILGDLFEFWFEYNIVFPKDYFKTLALLYNLIDNGTEVHYVLGNHEVMIGKFLKNFGFTVHDRQATLTLFGKKVLLAHGHMLDRRLWTTLWQKLLTSRMNHALYSLIHPDLGVFLAQGIAYLSRRQRRSPQAVTLLEGYARDQLQEYDVVVLAHSHVPVLKHFGNDKHYVNTGDWLEHYSYATMDAGGIDLLYYR